MKKCIAFLLLLCPIYIIAQSKIDLEPFLIGTLGGDGEYQRIVDTGDTYFHNMVDAYNDEPHMVNIISRLLKDTEHDVKIVSNFWDECKVLYSSSLMKVVDKHYEYEGIGIISKTGAELNEGKIKVTEVEDWNELQKLSFILGAYIRFGNSNTIVTTSASKSRKCVKCMNAVGFKNVEHRETSLHNPKYVISFEPTDEFSSLVKYSKTKYLELEE